MQNTLVSTARYGLSTTVAHHHSNQLHPDLFGALLGNTEYQYVFRVSQDDAKLLSPKMPPMSSKAELDRIENYFYRKLPFKKYHSDQNTIPLEKLDLSRFSAAPVAHLSDLSFEGQRAFPAES